MYICCILTPFASKEHSLQSAEQGNPEGYQAVETGPVSTSHWLADPRGVFSTLACSLDAHPVLADAGSHTFSHPRRVLSAV